MKKPIKFGEAVKKAIPDFGSRRKKLLAVIKPKKKKA